MNNPVLLVSLITICCIAFAASKIILSILLYKRWRKKQLIYEDGLSGAGKMVVFRNPMMMTQSLTSETFMKRTLKLSNKDIIGSGGFGTVYKLTINESAAFAVKRLHKGSSNDGDGGFEREVVAMGDIKHRNIVTLHGYCTASRYNLLIYELMPNGSLASLLHGTSRNKSMLDWATRYKIAVDSARGISYLHHDCIPHIIHRDIKSSNILLDHAMNARVSDLPP